MYLPDLARSDHPRYVPRPRGPSHPRPGRWHSESRTADETLSGRQFEAEALKTTAHHQATLGIVMSDIATTVNFISFLTLLTLLSPLLYRCTNCSSVLAPPLLSLLRDDPGAPILLTLLTTTDMGAAEKLKLALFSMTITPPRPAARCRLCCTA